MRSAWGGRTSPTRPVSRARPTTRKRPVEAGAVDAKNAPTAPWKTGGRFPTDRMKRLVPFVRW